MSSLRKRSRVNMEETMQENELVVDPHQNWSESIVFGELLQEILQNVPTPDLIQCRGVNKRWWALSQKILLKRDDHLLTFKYNPPKCTYNLKKKQDPKNDDGSSTIVGKSLGHFSQLTSSSQSQPLCTNFRFTGGNLECSEAENFFTNFGPSIKGLILDMWTYDQPSEDPRHVTSLDTFSRLLETKLPNLHSLTIRSFPTSWWGLQEAPSTFLTSHGLPQLQVLEVSAVATVDNPILRKIMEAAVNLKGTKFRQLDIPSTSLKQVALSASSKSHKVLTKDVNIRFLPDMPGEIESVEKFSMYKINLERLHFALSYGRVITPYDDDFDDYNHDDDHHARAAMEESDYVKARKRARGEGALLKIFVNAKNSLKIARFGPTAFALLNNLAAAGELPSFPNVVNFSLDGNHGPREWRPEVSQWFFKLSDLFPKVEVARIDLHETWPLASYCPPFSLDDQMTGVKQLTMYCNVMGRMFPSDLHLLMPGVEVMNLLVVRQFSMIAKHVWKFSKLKRLEFNLNLNANFFPHLDAAFTGMSLENVKKIYGQPTTRQLTDNELERLRENPSIVDLKELEHLEMSFEDWKLKLRPSYNFLTHATAQYAFKLMPKLQVKLSLDEWAIRNANNMPMLRSSLFPITSLDNVTIKQDDEEMYCS